MMGYRKGDFVEVRLPSGKLVNGNVTYYNDLTSEIHVAFDSKGDMDEIETTTDFVPLL